MRGLMMPGLMMDQPLTIAALLEHAARDHGDTEIVTRTVEGPIHRYTYRDALARAKQLAVALRRLGVEPGDRVATLGWNTHRHFEVYFAVSGLGAVCHTLNPRLFEEQLVYILNHAEDTWVTVDPNLVPLAEKLAPQASSVRGWIVLTDAEHMPETSLPNAHAYEDLVSAEAAAAELAGFTWPELDESAASSLCYTSGTTGNPKGVLFSHRSTVLHSYAVCLPDSLDLSARDAVLPVVPMFHANAWGLPYACPLVGAKIVFPGPHLGGASLDAQIHDEGVTVLAGVPTVWLMLLEHLRKTGGDLGNVERVVIGGSAAPRAMIEAFEKEYGVEVLHAWGMTEMSPLGTVCKLKEQHAALSDKEILDLKGKQGRAVYGVEMKIVDDDGTELPRDGKTFGELLVRGPWIAKSYFKGEGGDILRDGWFPTGDVATLDPDGYMQITDRAKDVIKSGGEWISSIDLENEAVGHPKVAEAAVIGIAHPKWDERPLLVVVPAEGEEPTRDEILEHLRDRVAKWWLPDDVVFVEELPHTATGKISKRQLRERFVDYELPSE